MDSLLVYAGALLAICGAAVIESHVATRRYKRERKSQTPETVRNAQLHEAFREFESNISRILNGTSGKRSDG
jgi:hypothetical protein